MNKNNSLTVGACVAALAATGFAAGFFGPIALNPAANQGPLLGIFITGPGGAVAGLILGLVLKWTSFSMVRKWQIVIGTCIVGAVVILYFCLPEPKPRGTVIDAKIVKCTAPKEHIDDAAKHWDERIAAVTWAPPRTGWKQDVERMLREEGVVIDAQVTRTSQVVEHRKPWNYRKLGVSSWQSHADTKTYFARYAGSDCATYQQQPLPLLFMATEQGSKEWPPADLQNFLSLALVVPVPDQYRTLVKP